MNTETLHKALLIQRKIDKLTHDRNQLLNGAASNGLTENRGKRVWTPEQREKMSKSAKARWANMPKAEKERIVKKLRKKVK